MREKKWRQKRYALTSAQPFPNNPRQTLELHASLSLQQSPSTLIAPCTWCMFSDQIPLMEVEKVAQKQQESVYTTHVVMYFFAY